MTDFTSPLFALLFFPTIVVFWLSRNWRTLQILFLLAASYLFYSWAHPAYLFLIIASSLIDYVAGNKIHASTDKLRRKVFLLISVSTNLGLLCFFKYANFFIANINSLSEDIVTLPAINVILPVGISFYTFQSMSYTIDIYRKTLVPARFLDFFFYVASFPQLVAGPIVRAGQFLPQLERPLHENVRLSGVFYVFYGLIKKLFVANILATEIVDPIFANASSFSTLDLYFGVVCYAFQIFFDFSAYSDIAIGLGRLIGLDLPVNFLSPYLASNPREFWKRWHISLSTWIRDYVYFPLGGSRLGAMKTYRNLALTMTLFGLWHGASWNFIVWGVLHGVYLVLWRLGHPFLNNISPQRPPEWVRKVFWRIFFFHMVCLAWIFFRTQGWGDATEFFTSFTSNIWISSKIACQLPFLFLLLISLLIHDIVEPRIEFIASSWTNLPLLLQATFFYAIFLTQGYLNFKVAPFIYFQF
jgi:alginate O-acetyltransferase complex protein AlgI